MLGVAVLLSMVIIQSFEMDDARNEPQQEKVSQPLLRSQKEASEERQSSECTGNSYVYTHTHQVWMDGNVYEYREYVDSKHELVFINPHKISMGNTSTIDATRVGIGAWYCSLNLRTHAAITASNSIALAHF